jgi:hypothetical protein
MNVEEYFSYWLASNNCKNDLGSRLAPPMRAPSMFGCSIKPLMRGFSCGNQIGLILLLC